LTSSFETSPDPEQPLIGEGGVRVAIAAPTDPYQALDDLMTVVEALCPTWPQRETFTHMDKMLL
jgi:hypothetical protein